jgi:hypothetical protein
MKMASAYDDTFSCALTGSHSTSQCPMPAVFPPFKTSPQQNLFSLFSLPLHAELQSQSMAHLCVVQEAIKDFLL